MTEIQSLSEILGTMRDNYVHRNGDHAFYAFTYFENSIVPLIIMKTVDV